MKIAPSILQNSRKCKDEPSEVISILIQYAQVLYGLRVENLPSVLWEACFQSICERFHDIRVVDVQNAFRFSQIEKKQYVTLTRDEVLEPIQQYWFGRILLFQELDRLENISNAEKEEINKDLEFKRKAKQLYFDSLNEGKWLGDEFEADAIARNFKEVLQQPEKDEIMRLAKIEEIDRIDKNEGNQFILVPSWRKIFSRIYIERMIEKRIKFIQD